MQHSTAQYSTAQHSTAQHSRAQHNTAHHSYYGMKVLEMTYEDGTDGMGPTVLVRIVVHLNIKKASMTHDASHQ